MKKFSLGSRKSQLLTCTGLVAAGLMSPMSLQAAMAACTPSANAVVCTGTTAGPVNFSATGDGFNANVGSLPGPVFGEITTDALTVNAGTFDGNVTVVPGSQIIIGSGSGTRDALIVNAGNNTVGGVNVNIDGTVRSDDAGALRGGDAVRLSGTGQSTFNVNIAATTGSVGGGSGNGINVLDAGLVTITNAGSLASGNFTAANAIRVGSALGSAITGSAIINNTGTITGQGGALAPVIYSRATGGTTINNNTGGRIGETAGVADDDLVIASTGSGGAFVINNNGTINGRLDFILASGSQAVTFNNYSATSWNTSGLTNLTNNIDTINNEGGTLNTTGTFATVLFFDGNDVLRNQENGSIIGTQVGHINFNSLLTTLDFGAGDDLMENIEGSVITATNVTIFDFGSGDDNFVNDNSTFTANGITTTFTFGTGADDFFNQNGGVMSLTNTVANNFFFGTGNSVDRFINTGGSSITLAGPLSSWSFGDGADRMENTGNSTFTSSSLANTLLFGDGGDVFLNDASTFSFTNALGVNTFNFGDGVVTDQFLNQNGATFNTAGSLTTMFFGEGDDDFVNTGNSKYNSSALANTFTMGDGADQFVNEYGSTIALTSNLGVHSFLMGSGDDDFWNLYGSTFNSGGISTTLSFGDGADEFANYDGSSFTSTSVVNTFTFGAGADEFNNTWYSDFLLQPAAGISANTLDFGADVDTLNNLYGSSFQADSLANSILNLENLNNAYGSTFELNGALNIIGFNEASGLASLVNTEGSYFELEGLSFVNFNGDANTFTNTYGSTFASLGATTVDFNGGTDTFNNYGGRVFSTGTPSAGPLSDIGLLTFLDLETFQADYGVTDMMDGDVLDAILMLDTTYVVNDDADHYIDAYLAGPSILGADTMVVNRVEGSGTTWVHVNDLSDGPGEYNPYGVAIVGVRDQDADIDDFRLADGPIEKGLFSYDIYLDQENSLGHLTCALDQDCFVIASVLGQRAYELPVLAYAAQQMWHTSTGVWTDRTADLRSAFGGTGFGGGGADAIVEPVEPMPVIGNVTPGIWGRVFGATQSRDFSNTSAPPPGLEGYDAEFNNNFEQNIYGAMAGIDFGKESLSNQGNQAWIFGLFGGYTGSNLSFDNSDTDVDYTAGSIGAYVTYLNGGLFVDTTIKADFGKMDYSSGGESASADYTSIGGVVDAGYRFTGGTGWYFEPKATLAYVHTDFDNMETFGTDVEFDNGESLRGRLGGRVGTSIDRNGILIEPYLEASVWNEFSGDYTASFVSNGFTLDPGFDADGVYGEVALGSSFINVGNGWSGFAKGAVAFGEDSALGLTGNLGVRKAW